MRRIAVGITLVAVLALMVLLGVRTVTSRPGEGTDVAIVPVRPKPAPGFDLKALDSGEPVQLSSYLGKVVVVSFGASWCASCRAETPQREAVWRQVKNSGDVQFIGIHVWDKEKDARAFAEEFGVTFPMALDGSGKVAIEYGITGVPETFIIDRAGVLVRRAIGPVDADELQQALVEVTGRTDLFAPVSGRSTGSGALDAALAAGVAAPVRHYGEERQQLLDELPARVIAAPDDGEPDLRPSPRAADLPSGWHAGGQAVGERG